MLNQYHHTLNQPRGKVWQHSTCRQQTVVCRHKSCSSCKTCGDGWSPSAPSQFPGHPAPGQTPEFTKVVVYNNLSHKIKIMLCDFA